MNFTEPLTLFARCLHNTNQVSLSHALNQLAFFRHNLCHDSKERESLKELHENSANSKGHSGWLHKCGTVTSDEPQLRLGNMIHLENALMNRGRIPLINDIV